MVESANAVWERSDEVEDKIAAASTDSSRKLWVDESFDLDKVKMLTRPAAIQNAEEKIK
jgi:hypothetical protein